MKMKWRRFAAGARKLWKNTSGRVGLLVLALMIFLAVFAPMISPFDPLTMDKASRLLGPTQTHLLGTDEYGRDLLSRILYGARSSLVTGIVSVTIAAFIGINLGLLAGYYRKWFDAVSMRLMDAIISFPATLLAVVVIAIMGTGAFSAMLAIAIVSIPSFARLARANMLTEVNKGYVQAGQALGYEDLRMIYGEILPNILSTLFVQMTVSIASAILLESALSFLGLGNPPPAPSWGAMLSVGKDYLLFNPWYAIFPGIFLTALITGLYLLGDGLRDTFDPRH